MATPFHRVRFATMELLVPLPIPANPMEAALAKFCSAKMKKVPAEARHIVMAPMSANILIQAVKLAATTKTSAPTPIPAAAMAGAQVSILVAMAMADAPAIPFADVT